MILVEPSLQYEEAFFKLSLDYKNHNELKYQFDENLAYDLFINYIDKLSKNKTYNKNKPDIVPETTFWLIEGEEISDKSGKPILRYWITI